MRFFFLKSMDCVVVLRNALGLPYNIVSDLIGNPEDRLSHEEAHMSP